MCSSCSGYRLKIVGCTLEVYDYENDCTYCFSIEDVISYSDTKIELAKEGSKLSIKAGCITNNIGCISDFITEFKLACSDTPNTGDETEDPVKEYQRTITVYPASQEDYDDKLKDYQDVDVWFDGITYCYVPCLETPLEDESNLIIIENFIKMNKTTLGARIQTSPLSVTPHPYSADGITICTDGTPQDVIALIKTTDEYAAFIASIKEALPTGAEFGLQSISIKQLVADPKRPVRCDVTDADAVISSNEALDIDGLTSNSSFAVTGDIRAYSKPQSLVTVVDGTKCFACNDITCILEDGDVTVTGEAGTQAFLVDFCVSCFIAAPEARK